jgi:hypothetical protein
VLVIFPILLVAIRLAFLLLAKSHLGTALAVVATFAVVPPLQIRVVRAAAGAPGLASSVSVGTFNPAGSAGDFSRLWLRVGVHRRRADCCDRIVTGARENGATAWAATQSRTRGLIDG